MLENPAPFQLNFSSPMKYYSKKRSSHIGLSPQPPPPPNQKKSPENVCTLPNNHYCM